LETNALHNACWIGDVARAALSLDRGAQIDQQEPPLLPHHPHHGTPLCIAASNGRTAVVQLLLERGASHQIEADDDSLRMPLFFACMSGYSDVVRLKLEVDTDVDHRCENGATALGYAAGGGHLKCVQALIDKGATIDAAESLGWTPLLAAVSLHDALNYKGEREGRLVAIARLLLAKGAAFDLKPSRPTDRPGWWSGPRWWSTLRRQSCADDSESDESDDDDDVPPRRRYRWRLLRRVRVECGTRMNVLFDSYLLAHYMIRVRLCVIGPYRPRPAACRRGFFGRRVVQRSAGASARYGLVDEPHLARHVASFLVR